MDNIINTDIVIVGGGPSGLATAIELANLNIKNDKNMKIMLIEKGADIGNHILSGAIIKSDVFSELLPDIPFEDIPFDSKVNKDKTSFFCKNFSFNFPFALPFMGNKGNHVGSLSHICRFLSSIAEEKGIEIYTGFSVDEIIYKDDKVTGVKIKDTGLKKDGSKDLNYQEGTIIYSKIVILAEGSRGSLTQTLIEKKKLNNTNPQTYSLGVKELWKTNGENIKQGDVYHTMGYPLTNEFGGGFIYGLKDNMVALGLVVGLDYEDPTFDIQAAFQIWKKHPKIQKILKNATISEFGAKTIPEGGYNAIPDLCSDNVLIVGDGAGLVTMPALKGIHLSIKSGMLAAKCAFNAIKSNNTSKEALASYKISIDKSLIYKDMYKFRNFRQSFSDGMLKGIIRFSTQIITNGAGFFGDLTNDDDYKRTKSLENFKGVKFSVKFKNDLQFDNKKTFDKVTNVFYSKTSHDEEQPKHLIVNNMDNFNKVNIKKYGAPCQFFCPADVYELTKNSSGDNVFKIHAENCVHCKTCDIKSVNQAITWVVPYGGNGPKYNYM